jgi:SAM-dependent methyltransferase
MSAKRFPPWRQALGRRAYHALPPRFWHSLDGLKRDLSSMRERLRDPERRKEPWETIHHVGSNYRATGQHVVDLLRTYADLEPGDRVLDIGCGNGRVTRPLVEALSPEGETRFPCQDGAITLAFANSVFTHLPLETIRRYLDETRRVLAPGGRAVFTAFVLTPQARDWIDQGRSPLPFKPWREGAMTVDPHWPENAVAYDEPLLRDAVEAAGLSLDRVLVGDWRPEPTYLGNQDMLIVKG